MKESQCPNSSYSGTTTQCRPAPRTLRFLRCNQTPARQGGRRDHGREDHRKQIRRSHLHCTAAPCSSHPISAHPRLVSPSEAERSDVLIAAFRAPTTASLTVEWIRYLDAQVNLNGWP